MQNEATAKKKQKIEGKNFNNATNVFRILNIFLKKKNFIYTFAAGISISIAELRYIFKNSLACGMWQVNKKKKTHYLKIIDLNKQQFVAL